MQEQEDGVLEQEDDIWGLVGGKLVKDDDDGEEVTVWDEILVEEVDDLEGGILDGVLADDMLVLENEQEDGNLVLEEEQDEEDDILASEDDILVLVRDSLV